MELRKFFRLFQPNSTDVISTAGYSKQRLKLNPEAFMYLSDFHVRNFYRDEMDNLLKLKGYFIFAVDGSKINLPNTSENIEYYGAQANQTGQQAQAGLSCCFDSLNKVILDCTINRITFSEREEVKRHIAKVPSFIGDHPLTHPLGSSKRI